MQEQALGVGFLPCPTTRLNYLTVRFQGRADCRQPPDPTEAQVGGRYRRPVCRRALGRGRACSPAFVGWAEGLGSRVRRCCPVSPLKGGGGGSGALPRPPYGPRQRRAINFEA